MDPRTERVILEEIAAARAAGGQRHAETGLGDEPLSSDVYTGDEHYRAEIERVFFRSWMPVAREAELAEPGRWVLRPVERARVVVARGEDGALRAFHNTCRHRGSALVDGDGCGKRLVCPYHGWSYGLDGRLSGVPDPQAYKPAFDPGRIRLGEVSVAVGWGYVWVNLRDDAPSLDTFLGPHLLDELANFRLEACEHKGSVERDGAFGWKLAVEGFIEPYHVPQVHRRSVHPILHNKHAAMAWWGDHSRMVMELRDPRLYEPEGLFGRVGAAVGVGMLPGLNTLQRTANFAYLVWPATILNLLPNHVAVFHLRPVAPDKTRVVLDVLGPPSKTDAQRAFWDRLVAGYGDLVDEDTNAFAGVQRGLEGPYKPALELSHYDRRIRHFRSRLAAWLASG